MGPSLSRRARIPARLAVAACVTAVTATGCRLGLPDPVTREGRDTSALWVGSTVAALVVGGLVLALIVWSMVRYRAPRDDDSLPAQTEYHVPLEIAYTVLPIVVVAALFGFTYLTQRRVLHTDRGDVVLDVTGFQWGWTFTYDQSGVVVQSGVLDVPEIVLPTGRPVTFRVGSTDVIHSFYVPRFLFKRDAIPGRSEAFTLTIEQPGTYSGHCAEFCGVAHANMNFAVRAVSPAEFEAWLAERSRS